MEQLERLEHNIDMLVKAYTDLKSQYNALTQENARQRQEIMQAHSDLLACQQKYKHLLEAYSLLGGEENKEKAYRQLTYLIEQIDMAIETLKK